MSDQHPFSMALKLLFVIPLFLMASSCGPKSSSGEIRPTGLPVPSAPVAAATALASPDPTLEASLARYHSQTACDSPYLPLRKGATWTYLTKDPQGGLSASEVITVTDLQGDLGQASATVSSQIPGAKGQLQTSEAKYTCDAQGIHLQGSALSSYTLPPELPSVDRLVAGASWQVSNLKTLQASAPCWGAGTYTRLSHYEVKGDEPVALAAAAGGLQSALRIDEVNSLSPLATPSAVCAQGTANTWWLVPGRGVVSHQAVVTHLDGSPDYTLVTDLAGATLP
jgi:hypothetical protein